jgi:serine/threonine protein kinase
MSSALVPGAIFATDFRVVRHLADGGMGSVYVVEQLSTGKQRALKTMHYDLARDPKHRSRFESEARISARIESDHVVEVLAAGYDQSTGLPWLVMELLRGDTLDELVERDGPRPPTEIREIARQLRHVLERAHLHGLVHRDLKPENVFLAAARREGVPFTVKILDFGIAKWVQEAQTANKNSQIIGSPLWMAPEQLTPGAEITPATDVWALGLIAFHLFCGKSYWRAANTEASSVGALLLELAVSPMSAASERAAEFGTPDLLPPGFDEWFARATVRAPGERFTDGALAMAALDRLFERALQNEIATEPTSPGAPPPVPRASLVHPLDVGGPSMDDPEMALRLARVFELRDSDLERAVGAYRRVLELAPGSAEALRGLGDLFRRAENWTALAEVLEHDLSVRTLSPVERASRLVELAELRRQRFDDLPGAEQSLRDAIAADPASRRAVEALASVLAERGSIEQAVEVVEAAASELTRRGDQDGRFALLCRIADLHSTRVDLREAALDALRRASSIRPDAVEVRARYAGLYARSPDAEPAQAREHWRDVLAIDLRSTEAWQALFDLGSSSADGRWCLTDAAVAVLGDATPPALRAHHAAHESAATRAPQGRLDDASFLGLLAGDLDPRATEWLAPRSTELRAKYAKPIPTFGVTFKEHVDPATSSRALLALALPSYRALHFAAGVLDVPAMPAVYFRAGAEAPFAHLASLPPASLVSPPASWSTRELAFAAAEHMTFYRPELRARVLIPDLVALSEELSAIGLSELEVERWVHEADRVAARAGLVLSRDLAAARKVLSESPLRSQALSAPERFRDLVLFATSTAYTNARRKLGVALPD